MEAGLCCKVRSSQTKFSWYCASFSLNTQSKKDVVMTESAFNVLFQRKFNLLSRHSKVRKTSTLTYVELYSMKDCEVFLQHGEYSGGLFVEEDGRSTFVYPKAFIEYQDGSGREIGYVENITDGIARVHISHIGPVNLELPSLLNRPYNYTADKKGMVLIQITPVRFKFSTKTLKMTAIYHRATFSQSGLIESHLST